jgi:Protein of unknown function (DUF3631)
MSAAVLDDVEHFIRRFVAFPREAHITAVTLWIAHAHAVQAFESTPRLAIISAEKGSGKTRTLEILELLVPNPEMTANMSTAVMFRTIDKLHPTVMFDEIDTIFGPKASDDHEDLRGLINAGHRKGATVMRCDGPKNEVKRFKVFAAVVLAGLGELPDTIADRSVIVRMKRRAPHEVIEGFRRRKVKPEADVLRERLEVWALEWYEWFITYEPSMPSTLTDRPADVWEALLSVADAAGGEWPERARHAAIELQALKSDDAGSVGVRLLADIRSVWVKGEDKVTTEDLLSRLVALDESPWADFYGKPLDARGLARKLAPYEVSPKQVRVAAGTYKGYELPPLMDAWSRYLRNSETTETKETPQVSGGAVVSDVSIVSLPGGTESPKPNRAATSPCRKCHEQAAPLFGPADRLLCRTCWDVEATMTVES